MANIEKRVRKCGLQSAWKYLIIFNQKRGVYRIVFDLYDGANIEQ